MDTPSIYVACLAAYNEGFLHGIWIEATKDVDDINDDIQSMLAKSPVEASGDFAIHDYEGFEGVEFSEYTDIETVAEIAEFIEEHGQLGAKLLNDFDIEEARTFLEDHYHGAYDDEVDFARSLFEDCYSGQIPENLLFYFDFERFAQDLFICDYFSVDVGRHTHVFLNC